jgi:GNAT superfamily N-acetyltransferase
MATTVSDLQPLTVRHAAPGDAAAVAELSGQLGYSATAEEVRDRIVALASCAPSQAVFVACLAEEVLGWVDVALTFHLQTAPFALIGGLVVKDSVRGRAIGKRLCDEAEAWGRAQGVSAMRVTSRSTRTDAHRFYLREGYTEVKTSRVFEKRLS